MMGLEGDPLNAHILAVFVQSVLEAIDCCCIHNLLRQTVPVSDDSLTKEELPGVCVASLHRHLHTMTPEVMTCVGYLEELFAIDLLFSCHYFVCLNKVTPLPPLLKCCQPQS